MSAEHPTKRRRAGRAAAIVAGTALVVGAIFWRQVAVIWCVTIASTFTDKSVIAWNCGALARLGRASIPGLCRLVENPDLARAWCGGAGLYCMFRDRAEDRDALRELLRDPRERVRSVAAMVLVSGPWHEAEGVPVIVRALDSEDRDVRLYAAYYLSYYPPDRFERDAPDPPAVFARMAAVLAAGREDGRDYFTFNSIDGVHVSGIGTTVGGTMRAGLERLNPEWKEKPVPELSAAALYEAAKKAKGAFFVGAGDGR